MKNTLFILTEDLNNGVIQSQVFSHIEFLKEKKISNASIIFCYWNTEESNSSLKKINNFIKIFDVQIYTLKIWSPKFPFSTFINEHLIFKFITKSNIKLDYIHARTDFCAVISKKTRDKKNIGLIWDCRGFAPAEIDYESSKFKIFKKFYLYYRFRRASKISDKVIVVSNILQKRVKKLGHMNSYLVPSVATTKLFYFDQKKRDYMRKKMKFNNSSIVFIYSGSLKKYQMIDETLSIFQSLYLENNNSHLIILTKDTKKAKILIKGFKNISCISVNQKNVNDYLNAADFALMIRKKDLTNEAASPTKFSEYCLSGLNIITNSSVTDFYKYKKEVSNILDINNLKLPNLNFKKRNEIAKFYKSQLSRESFFHIFKEIYE